MKVWTALEKLLSALPRTVLLAVAVVAMRNRFAEGSLDSMGWYVRLPLEFVGLLLLSATLAAGLRLAKGHGSDAPDSLDGKPFA